VATYHFEVGIEGGLSDEQLDQLAERGCDDATFSTSGQLSFADFDREAPSLLEAIMSAIDAIESVDSLFVMKVGPESWCGHRRSQNKWTAPAHRRTC
jgi:hypothetical protein